MGENFKVVKVLDHKEIKMGDKAAVPFMSDEFMWLQQYIEHLRPLLCSDTELKNVFPAMKNMTNTIDRELSYGALYNILQQFQSKSGVKLGSRNIRRARITNSRNAEISFEKRTLMAKAMNHSVQSSDC